MKSHEQGRNTAAIAVAICWFALQMIAATEAEENPHPSGGIGVGTVTIYNENLTE